MVEDSRRGELKAFEIQIPFCTLRIRPGKEGFGVKKPYLPPPRKGFSESKIPIFPVVPCVLEWGFFDPEGTFLGGGR